MAAQRILLHRYAAIKEFKPESIYILTAALSNGEIPRGDAERLTGLKERSARSVLSSLTEDGILSSSSPKGPVSLRFNVDSARILFPKLFDDIPPEPAQIENQGAPPGDYFLDSQFSIGANTQFSE